MHGPIDVMIILLTIPAEMARDLVKILSEAKQVVPPELAEMSSFGGGGGGGGRGCKLALCLVVLT